MPSRRPASAPIGSKFAKSGTGAKRPRPVSGEDAERRRYTLMFEHLRAAASGLDATAALLEAIVSETQAEEGAG